MNQLPAITIDMKAPEGYTAYCMFSLPGHEAASHIFAQLKGVPDAAAGFPLRISLTDPVSTRAGSAAVIYCRLDELLWNCRLITREIFKYHHFG